MKTIIHDLGDFYDTLFKSKCENVISADVFFIIISIFQGGIFRGWLRKK